MKVFPCWCKHLCLVSATSETLQRFTFVPKSHSFPSLIHFWKTTEKERSHGPKFFCERMKCAIMQVLRVDVVRCTFAELCYRGESQKLKPEEIFLFFVVNLSVARCWECSVGNWSRWL